MSAASKLENVIDSLYEEVEDECREIADSIIKNYDVGGRIEERVEEYFVSTLPQIIDEVKKQINSEEFLNLFVQKIISNPAYLEKLCVAMFDKH